MMPATIAVRAKSARAEAERLLKTRREILEVSRERIEQVRTARAAALDALGGALQATRSQRRARRSRNDQRRPRLGRNPAASSYYRLTDHHGRLVVECNSIDFLKGMIRHLPRGCYAVDQMPTWSLPLESKEKRWGTIVKLDDDSIIEVPFHPMPIGEATCRTWDARHAMRRRVGWLSVDLSMAERSD
jgi:hypothetical protein